VLQGSKACECDLLQAQLPENVSLHSARNCVLAPLHSLEVFGDSFR
jgi:hypothetical protein